ncbi:hypothetical protein R1sor_019424 [Riccia sorocarpa]|uniref:Uncharacterized protein n=1 Tax=Riccia sorocarpa TaxID=122646 RepID=A0ABD3ICM7_9MARC
MEILSRPSPALFFRFGRTTEKTQELMWAQNCWNCGARERVWLVPWEYNGKVAVGRLMPDVSFGQSTHSAEQLGATVSIPSSSRFFGQPSFFPGAFVAPSSHGYVAHGGGGVNPGPMFSSSHSLPIPIGCDFSGGPLQFAAGFGGGYGPVHSNVRSVPTAVRDEPGTSAAATAPQPSPPEENPAVNAQIDLTDSDVPVPTSRAT